MNTVSRYLPRIVVAIAAIYLIVVALPPRDREGEMRLREFGKLPVVDGGRVKPLDTLARNNLTIFSGRDVFYEDDKKAQPAIRWLLDVMTSELGKNRRAEKHKVFRIDHDQLLAMLDLKPRIEQEFKKVRFRHALDEFAGKEREIAQQAARANKIKADQQDAFDRKVLALYRCMETYVHLATLAEPHAVPSPDGKDWKPLMAAVHALRENPNGADEANARSFATLLIAYGQGDAAKFNRELTTYRQRLSETIPDHVSKAEWEVFFNHFAPFLHCSILYVAAFVLVCFSWIGWTQPLNRSAFWLLVLTLSVHTLALCLRMYLQGRPPVTNLYSSAVFIGWGCVVIALILEMIYRNSIANAVAGIAGFATLLIAYFLAADGDTLEMMQAVLDTNFWLATHVTCVTMGYASTFMAGLVGILFVLRGVFTPSLQQDAMKTMGRMIYGIICFATFFSFTGTVLGGIWADQSWGRFWGWDPKENGALIIVLWNALILHARWGGMVKERGIAVLAVFGNIVTSWSWFGTNLLGVGLHAYGFKSGTTLALIAFVLSQLAIVWIGLLPKRFWWSFAKNGNGQLAVAPSPA